MFKVIENPDGSSSIFCKRSGKYMCQVNAPKTTSAKSSVKSPVKSSGKSPVKSSVKTPLKSAVKSPLKSAFKSPYKSPSKKNTSKISGYVKEEPKSDDFCYELSIPLPPEKEELDNDCIDEDAFFSFFKLIRKDKADDPVFKATLPKREIAKVPSFTPNPRRTITNYEKYVDISSPLGVRLYDRLHKNNTRRYLSEPGYEKYCSSVSPTNTTLRSREQPTQFPINFRTNRRQKTWVHTYSFTTKDKFEKNQRLKTGLNKESRILKAKCKKMTISTSKLTMKEMLDNGVTDFPMLEKISKPRLLKELWKREISANFEHYSKSFKVTLIPFEKMIMQRNERFWIDQVPLSEGAISVLENKKQNSFLSSNFNINNPTSRLNSRTKLEAKKNKFNLPLEEKINQDNIKNKNGFNKISIIHLKKNEPSKCLIKSNISNNYGHNITRSLENSASHKQLNGHIVSNNILSPKLNSPLYFNKKPNHKDWKLTLPTTVDASKWTFICYKCSIDKFFKKKELATLQITEHMNTYHYQDDPEYYVQQCCIKYADHIEVKVQAFSIS